MSGISGIASRRKSIQRQIALAEAFFEEEDS
jgi:hypothetical protein